MPNPDTFPAERFASIAERVIRERRSVALQYGPTRGLPRLTELIAGVCRQRSAQVEGVAQDDDGIVLESLDEVARRTKPKLLYTIPNFQNPSGRLMSQKRRAKVLELAERYDFLVIEDDPYGELLYVDADTTPIKSSDRRNCSRNWRSPSRRPISARGCWTSRSSMNSAPPASCRRRSRRCGRSIAERGRP